MNHFRTDRIPVMQIMTITIIMPYLPSENTFCFVCFENQHQRHPPAVRYSRLILLYVFEIIMIHEMIEELAIKEQSVLAFMLYSFILFVSEIHERIEYSPGSGQRVLFPDAELQMCGESSSSCETKRVSVRISLATNHIGKGCDRDTYSLESQRKLCGNYSNIHFSFFILLFPS